MTTHPLRNLPFAWLATGSLLVLAACGGGGATANSGNTESTNAASSGSAASAGSEGSAAPATTDTASSSTPSNASTAGPVDAPPAASAAPAAPAVPDAAMHVQSTAGATGWFAHIDIERRDDASLYFAGTEIGRMNAGHITTIDGQAVPLEGRLSVGVRGHREHLEMQPDGSVVMDMGRLTVDASGEVQVTRGTTTRPAHVHITGYSPSTARLATILLTYGIMKADLSTR